MKNLSEMWPVFLEWVKDYVDGETHEDAAKCSYSREDMRYAFQGGYELYLTNQKVNNMTDTNPETNEQLTNLSKTIKERGYLTTIIDGRIRFDGAACPSLVKDIDDTMSSLGFETTPLSDLIYELDMELIIDKNRLYASIRV